MKKVEYYTYLGTNGILTTPIHLEDIYYTTKYLLVADVGKKLTKDGKNFYNERFVTESEVGDWSEVIWTK